MKTSGARRIRSSKWNKLVKRVIFYVIMIGFIYAFIDSTETGWQNGTNGKAGVVSLREEQGGKLPSLFLFLSFFFIYRSRKIKLWSGLRPERIRNDGWSGTNDSPVCDDCFTRTSFEYNSARLDSFDIFLQHTLSPPFYPVASCKFRFCSRCEILETRFIRFVGGWCKCPKITFPRLLRKLDGFKIHYPKSGVTNSDNTLLLLVSERKTIRKTNLT